MRAGMDTPAKAFENLSVQSANGVGENESGKKIIFQNVMQRHLTHKVFQTTSGAPTEMLMSVFDGMIEKQFIRHICRTMIGEPTDDGASAWINMGSAAPEGLDAHIAKVKERFGLK
jgi:hypothetical protein